MFFILLAKWIVDSAPWIIVWNILNPYIIYDKDIVSNKITVSALLFTYDCITITYISWNLDLILAVGQMCFINRIKSICTVFLSSTTKIDFFKPTPDTQKRLSNGTEVSQFESLLPLFESTKNKYPSRLELL